MVRKTNKRRTDPTVARAKVRGAARSAFGFVARLLGAAVVVAGTFAAVIATYLWMTTSSRFAVREVDIAGNHHATLAELAPLTGLAQGTNLFLVDADEVAARLESHPWVRTAVVRRIFPSTVKVTVDEHRAVALVALGGLYLADAEGQVFKRAVPGDPMGLPVITGLKRGEGEAGRAALEAGVRQALTVARDWRHSPMAKVARLSEIHLDPRRRREPHRRRRRGGRQADGGASRPPRPRAAAYATAPALDHPVGARAAPPGGLSRQPHATTVGGGAGGLNAASTKDRTRVRARATGETRANVTVEEGQWQSEAS